MFRVQVYRQTRDLAAQKFSWNEEVPQWRDSLYEFCEALQLLLEFWASKYEYWEIDEMISIKDVLMLLLVREHVCDEFLR